MEQSPNKARNTGSIDPNSRKKISSPASNLQKKNISKIKNSSPSGKIEWDPVDISRMKGVRVRMVRAGTYLVPGKGIVKTPEKKHKTILNSMRKSPVKKAMEEKQEKHKLENKDAKLGEMVNVESPKKQVKKIKDLKTAEGNASHDIPDIVVTPSKENNGKIKKHGSMKIKDKVANIEKDEQTPDVSPKSKQKQKVAAKDTPKGKSRTPSKSPSPSRKKKDSPDQCGADLQTSNLTSDSGKIGKRSRSPNAKFKTDMIIYPWDSDKKSPKKSPKTRTSPRSGTSSKSSSSSKNSSASDDSYTAATGSSYSSSSSNDTTPDKGSPPHNNSNAVKKLFPPDETDGHALLTKEQPMFDGLDNCSITVDDKSLGMLKSYKYKYSSSGDSKSSNTLSDLIAKVNSNIETPDLERNKIFGTAEDLDTNEEISSTGEDDELNDNNDSMDSDKTVTDFDGTSDVPSMSQEKVSDKNCQDLSHSDETDVASIPGSTKEMAVDLDGKGGEQEKSEETKADESVEKNEVSSNDEKNEESNESEKEITDEKDEDKHESEEEVEEVNIFDHFGLKLRRKSETLENQDTITEDKDEELNKEKQDQNEIDDDQDDDDVVCISDTSANDVVVISDDESIPKRKKFPCVNHIVEPKPIQILTNVERQVKDKSVAFLSEELEEYIDVNKDSMGPLYRTVEEKSETSSSTKTSPISKDYSFSPDMDEVNGFMFVSFSSEEALKAHEELEKKLDWLTEATLKKLSQLKVMKERQIDAGKRRVTDVKSVDEQKHNFRGTHMKYTKYQKLLKQEYENITESCDTPEKLGLEKTSDITKIKGWKNKFKNAEDLQEAARVNLMESGKLHWRTEDRLLRDMDPDDMRDIGLDLKKKRRKLVSYSSKKKHCSSKTVKQDEDLDNYEYYIDEDAITEKDVYNENDEKPLPDKVPYCERYLSQHKYVSRKYFVKKMRLDATDEQILKKLGTQKLYEKDTPISQKPTGRGRQLVFSKITQSMAIAAVSALDGKLLNKAKRLTENTRKTRSRKDAVEEHDGPSDVGQSEPVDDNDYLTEDYTSDPQKGAKHVNIKPDLRGKDRLATLPLFNRDRREKERRKSLEKCDQPGCRYGCICHLCKLSDSGEEKESENKPPCEKEYCKLGCICDSIDTKQTKETKGHCRKPACMFECRCPPKQPKPDIPKVKGRKKKKGKASKKKLSPVKVEMEDDVGVKEVEIIETEREDKEEDWEPPSKKKKRSGSGNRFANLPKRESTYRLAKNLDAVSRKAMIVYESSEMFTGPRSRSRRSDPIGYYVMDDPFNDLADASFPPVEGTRPQRSQSKTETELGPLQKLNPVTGAFEISDDSEVEEDQGTCSRFMTYSEHCNRKQHVKASDGKSMGGSDGKPSTDTSKLAESSSKPEVIDLDTDEESKDNSEKSQKPVSQLTVSQRLSIAKKLTESQPEANKWKTQMVCLKAKKKSDEKSSDSQSEIKLLEIISNCSWENDRTNMLSKISHIISQEYPANFITMWQSYVLQFLPKADKPAVIPQELQSKLPNGMYSIRVRVTKNLSDIEQAENNPKEDSPDKVDDEGLKNMSDEERKKYCVVQQRKLIEKIKFAERLRDLIKNEELKGISPSKFSVSLEGIEKALKRYKTQLWKAYTGTSNKSLMQIKSAVQALKGTAKGTSKPMYNNDGILMPTGCGMSSGTLSRLQSNQGLKLQNSVSVGNAGKAFISLGSMVPCTNVTSGNITVKSQDSTQGKSIAPVINKPSPAALTVTAPSLKPKTNEVLLIPVQDGNSGTWNPSAAPVFTAKVTMIPADGTKTSINSTVMNSNPISSPGIVPSNMPVTFVVPPRASLSNLPAKHPRNLTKPILNPALTAYANAPLLPGFMNKPVPVPAGSSQILFSSIQAVSTGSPVFSQVQSLMTQGVPLTPVQVAPLKSGTPVGIIRPQVPPSAVTSGNPNTSVNVTKDNIPSSVSGKPPNLNAFPPIRYATPLGSTSSGPVTFITNTNTNSKQPVILLPMSSTTNMPPGASPGQAMIAVPVSNFSAAGLPPVQKPMRMVSPQTVNSSNVAGFQKTVNAQQKQESVPRKDLNGLKSGDSKPKSEKSITDKDCVGNNKEKSAIEAGKEISKETTGNVNTESLHSVCSAISDGSQQKQKTGENLSQENSTKDSPTCVSKTLSDQNQVKMEELKADINEIDIVEVCDDTDSDTKSQGNSKRYIAENAESKSQEGAQRKRKGEDLASDIGNIAKMSKRIGSFTATDSSKQCTLESNEPDIDIVSLDKSMPDNLATQLLQSNRRKSQQISMSLDDFQIKTVKVPNPKKPVPMTARSLSERTRRHHVKYCRSNLSKVVFKYNPDILNFSQAIPEHLILNEALKLIRALQHKAARLEESMADGTQYQLSLRDKLKRQIEEFVKSGVPEPIIKNFLKSVSKAALSTFPPKRKQSMETIGLEDPDTDLDYVQLSTEEVLRNKNTSLEKVLEVIGEDFTLDPSPIDSAASSQFLISKLESLDPNVYIDNPEEDILSDTAEFEHFVDVNVVSDEEVRSSTGDVILESDIVDLEAEEHASSIVNSLPPDTNLQQTTSKISS